AFASPAMAWLGRYRRSVASFRNRAAWSAPALVILRFDPDPRSATAIRRSDPDWASHIVANGLRDRVTHSPIEPAS
ncbi:MAG: nicotinic acid mononucleotide adenylyltransferase, partial [Novosphingobium sp.]